jgi:hypothetical protein
MQIKARIAAVILLLIPLEIARAHEGPPFPIVNDRQIGNMLVSVWTDPDIGTGTFFVVLEPLKGHMLPDGITIDIGVTPVSGRLEEVLYRAEPQEVRHGARHFTEVQFDQGERWNVRVLIKSADGSGIITSEVEATPDGTIGPMGMILYLLPFLAVGFLWLKAVMRKRQASG